MGFLVVGLLCVLWPLLWGSSVGLVCGFGTACGLGALGVRLERGDTVEVLLLVVYGRRDGGGHHVAVLREFRKHGAVGDQVAVRRALVVRGAHSDLRVGGKRRESSAIWNVTSQRQCKGSHKLSKL